MPNVPKSVELDEKTLEEWYDKPHWEYISNVPMRQLIDALRATRQELSTVYADFVEATDRENSRIAELKQQKH